MNSLKLDIVLNKNKESTLLWKAYLPPCTFLKAHKEGKTKY